MKLTCANPFAPHSYTGEKPYGPSMAVPDQSMTVQEILKRYARGLPLGGAKVPTYEDEELEGMPDVKHMDLAEREEYFDIVKQSIERTKKSFNENATKTKKQSNVAPTSVVPGGTNPATPPAQPPGTLP